MNYLSENIRRNALLDAPYDPYLGIGSPIERQPFELSDLPKLYLPLSMLNVEWIQKLGGAGSLRDYVKKMMGSVSKEGIEVLQSCFIEERLNHEFEYWTAVCCKIKPKKGGDFISFVLNPPQRELLRHLEEMRLSDKAIFLILLKSRQFGGSTLIQVYMLWIQVRHRLNWNSLIAAHVNQAAINVRSMVNNIIKKYPREIDQLTIKPFENAINIKIIPERSNKITIGSMEKPDSIRSDDVKMAHLTEVGIWKKTLGKEPEDMIQSILGTIPIDEPYALLALESTAKGVGNYFHRTWQQAVKGDNVMRPIFIPWLKDQKNRIPLDVKVDEFVKSFTDYDTFLWNKGATLEGINFYRKQLKLFNSDKWRMQSEFPTTPEEAFQSTGNRFFPPNYVLALRKDNKEPIFRGDIIADATRGENALKNIRLEKNERGDLWIWEMPENDGKYTDRYVVSMDIGGTTGKADWSIIRAFDRLPMLEGGDPKAILTWKGHIDPDLLAWKGVQIASICDNALFVPEENSLEKEKMEDGEHFQTILNQVSETYRNIYIRNDEEKVGNDFVAKYGWNTNKKTKGLVLDALKAAARERMNKDLDCQDGYCYIEYDERNCSEMDCMEIKQNGKVGATDGEHDDFVLCTAIGIHQCINVLPIPKSRESDYMRRSTRRTESTF